ncbi:[NiFe] hydrogenase assembly HybE family chaperone [Modicisalibacter xianhensis]|uniref:[NiFe] hydrogenase assembly HybE family chaperone n=1 Tax=Modicisalibacter xianhensis TaxID=442341 RepID=A0A4R8FXJ0_9GAMM|nr:[NiFe]-hydrogenase assembly chaperone HybE [Halomonas xianhensis]TDX28973.1 [NiFe] hydrogenase assembly HybE family chaperone [Halomonas xianhensis]
MQALRTDDYQRLERLARAWLRQHALEYKDSAQRNPALGVDALCFQAFENELVGVLVTPLSLSLIILPCDDGNDADIGDTSSANRRIVTLPSGQYAFMPVTLADLGQRLWRCELLDDMSSLDGPDEACRLAQRVMQRVMTPTTVSAAVDRDNH